MPSSRPLEPAGCAGRSAPMRRGMQTRVVIKVPAIGAITLLSAVAAMLLLSPAYGLREYASMVIWCSIAAGK